MSSSNPNLTADEITSLIIDIGAKYLRVGFSGEDCPSLVMTSSVGTFPDNDQIVFGDLNLHSPRPNMEIRTILTFNEILDWNLLEGLLDFAVSQKLGCKWTEYPVLLVDNPFWSQETRERMVQLFFDKFEIPGLFLGRSPVLALFFSGKHTGLVVDCGASAIRICPVYEGYLMKGANSAAMQMQPLLGGNELSDQCKKILSSSTSLKQIHIPQQIASKQVVDIGSPPQFEVKMLKDVTDSFLEYHQRLILDDFKESTVQVSEVAFNEKDLSMRPARYYEFPDGFNKNFILERYRIGEQIFDPAFRVDDSGSTSISGLAEMIKKSLSSCDIEIQSQLLANINLTGGGSGLHGLAERLNHELTATYKLPKVRVHMAATCNERRFGIWIGGSILASLSTFQQLWLTKQEYKEHGAAYIDRKCP